MTRSKSYNNVVRNPNLKDYITTDFHIVHNWKILPVGRQTRVLLYNAFSTIENWYDRSG